MPFAHPAGLTCGAFEQLFGTGGRIFDRQKSKNSNARRVARSYKLIGALWPTSRLCGVLIILLAIQFIFNYS